MIGVDDAANRFWRGPDREGPSGLKVVGDVPPDLAICADENGSPVSVDPVDWYICFVPGLRRQWWHRFAHHKHKHVFAMRPMSTGSWLLVEPWWTRMMVTVLSPADAVKFLRWGETGDVLRVREAIPGKASQLRGWSNCAVLTAFVLGRSSWAWTPHGLYRELLRERDTRHVNVQQLLIDQFADVCAQHGPKPVVAVPTKILAKAKQAGEVDLADREAGARQFLRTLYGSIHLKAMLQLGKTPTLSEIDLRARSTVKTFLDGAVPDKTPILARRSLRPREEHRMRITHCPSKERQQ